MPTTNRGLPSVSLLYNGTLLLFDCGEGTQRQMMKFKVHFGSVRHIFISHMHLDHYLGLFGLIQTLELNSRTVPLDVFIPKGYENKIKSVIKLPKFVNLIPYESGEILTTKDFTVTAFPLEHSIETYGFVFKGNDKKKFDKKKADMFGIKGKMFSEVETKSVKIGRRVIKFEDVGWVEEGFKMVYATDTLPTKQTITMSKDADYLIHDSTFIEDESDLAKDKKHSTVAEAAMIAKKANVKKYILYHISPRYKNIKMLEKRAKEIFENSILPDDGTSFRFA